MLFQDLAAIPLIAAVPLLGGGPAQTFSATALAALKVFAAIAGIIIGGRYLLRPAFRLIASTKTAELFTAATLLLVLGVALLMESIGLSMALGSFLAGILLADSEYRHELEADIEPFKGLLLGLFFMSVGMNVDYSLFKLLPFTIFGLVVGLLAVKFSVNYVLGRKSGLDPQSARNLAMILPQGGEFAFVVFGAAVSAGVMEVQLSNLLVVVVTISMALTPLLVLFNDRSLKKILKEPEVPFDEIKDEENLVIIAGFGRFGQIAGRLLRIMNIDFTALDHDQNQVETLRQFGSKVYYGDASKLELLKSANADKAKLFILAIDDVQASVKTAAVVRQHFPHVKILARARNRSHVHELMDLGITDIWRETYSSSLELVESALLELGLTEFRVSTAIRKFRSHDERMLIEQHKVYHDRDKLISLSKQAAQQLYDLLQNDREGTPEEKDLRTLDQ